MGWVDVTEPFAAPPRVPDTLASAAHLVAEDEPLDLYRCRLERADLSRRRVRAIRESRLVGCKLTGADLAGAPVEDSAFEECLFGYTNLRMARLERVHFGACIFEEADAYEARLTDVDFGDSRLRSLDVDRVTGERVDLRGAHELGLRAVGRLDGWLIDESQLPAMMYALAAGAGLGIERLEEP